MQENYSSVTLKELSDFFNYSERQIQRIIKKSTGISFSENIQKLKMRKAARLLSNPNVSVTAIAEELGYSDQGSFRHIFRKYYGMTPIEYREHSHTSALIGRGECPPLSACTSQVQL
ncbi:MAG: helix-turn-helix transcriptional regulator [Clostridiales bacterium]|nr:helix-turn-helix transcriptional regulator [Clostridiales bacterium]